MIQNPQSERSKQTNAAMNETRKVIVERSQKYQAPIVLWRDGKIVELEPFSSEFDDAKYETTKDNAAV